MKTKPVVDRYTFRVTWSEEDQQHVGLCTEFPSLSWLANTPETALRGIRKVVRDVVADMAKNGESVPEPLAMHAYSGRLLVRLPPEVHRALAFQAAEAGISLNRHISSRLTGNS